VTPDTASGGAGTRQYNRICWTDEGTSSEKSAESGLGEKSKTDSSFHNDDSKDTPVVLRRKHSDDRRTQPGLDYTRIVEEDCGKCEACMVELKKIVVTGKCETCMVELLKKIMVSVKHDIEEDDGKCQTCMVELLKIVASLMHSCFVNQILSIPQFCTFIFFSKCIWLIAHQN
jgi:hypothetical protein